MASDTVDGINRTFGWMLLLSMTFFFVAIINASYVVFSLDKQITAGDLVFLLFALVHLTLVCFVADHISINVLHAKKLSNLNSDNLELNRTVALFFRQKN